MSAQQPIYLRPVAPALETREPVEMAAPGLSDAMLGHLICAGAGCLAGLIVGLALGLMTNVDRWYLTMRGVLP